MADGIESESSEDDPGVIVDEASACHTVEFVGFVDANFERNATKFAQFGPELNCVRRLDL